MVRTEEQRQAQIGGAFGDEGFRIGFVFDASDPQRAYVSFSYHRGQIEMHRGFVPLAQDTMSVPPCQSGGNPEATSSKRNLKKTAVLVLFVLVDAPRTNVMMERKMIR